VILKPIFFAAATSKSPFVIIDRPVDGKVSKISLVYSIQFGIINISPPITVIYSKE
jgi:hypothetical protein